MRFAAVSILLVLMCSFAAAQTATATHPAATKAPPASTATTSTMSDADVQALRADLAKMKAIVEQMQNNLANVSTAQDPLKHQFQLEIDMWNVVIGEMERKLDAAEKK